MKYIAPLFLLLALASAPAKQARADTQLAFTPTIELLALNGQEFEQRQPGAGQPLTLADGTHQLLVRYTAEVDARGNDTELVHSNTFVILFSATNQQVTLSVPAVDDEAAMEAFNRHPEWQLRDENGNRLPVETAPLVKEGFQFSRNYAHELDQFNRSGNPAAYTQLAAPAPSFQRQANHTSPSHVGPAPAAGLPLQMLQYWYQAADDETRNKFKAWIDKK